MTFFGIIGTAIVGLVVGALAKWLMPGKDPSGFFVTMAIGVAGAFLARFVGQAIFGWYGDGGGPGWIMSILGALLVLWLFRLIMSRT
ncbi:MAG: GlsB/YeaQ/YmgE family stress response membrane protein [Sandarakinorhabdus sp.]|nr:GlsB/YeaQ/YmgE family stress response membrane protein [Sandarakinorhabdus sp.]